MKSWLKRFGQLRRLLLVVAAVLLLVAIALPVWQITISAPQYPPPEGPLEVELYLYPALGGDYEEVNRLNHYVGFYYPDPVLVEADFPVHERSIQTPEWAFAPWIFVVLAALALFVSVAPSTRKLKLGLISLFVGTAVVFVGALVAVQARLYQAGHSLDPDAPMDLEGFTPPVLGSYEVANLSGTTWLGAGAWLTLAAVGLMFVAMLLRNSDVGLHRLFQQSGDAAESTSTEMVFSMAAAAMLAVLVAVPLVPSPPAEFADDGLAAATDHSSHAPPPVASATTAAVGDRSFSSAQRAIDEARSGDTVVLRGRFDESLTIDTEALTVRGGDGGAVVDGGGEGRVVTVNARDVTVEHLWIRNSGDDLAEEDAGIFVAGDARGVKLNSLYLDDIAFGIWVDGADKITIADCEIRGRSDVFPIVERGNGIQLWNVDAATIEHNRITEVRDGIYFSWAEGVVATDNHLANNRYGVHYMYSSHNRLQANTAIHNDTGYALMVSNHLQIIDNVAADNSGASGHGILVKDIDDSLIRGNAVMANHKGLYVYHSQNNRLENNLVLRNDIGIHHTAGSNSRRVTDNSFIDNEEAVITTGHRHRRWNENYWSAARTIDLDHDGTSEIRYRPAGLVEHLVDRFPAAAVFANSPAFDAVRLAEDSFPVIEAPGVVDERPLVSPPHSNWQRHETGL